MKINYMTAQVIVIIINYYKIFLKKFIDLWALFWRFLITAHQCLLCKHHTENGFTICENCKKSLFLQQKTLPLSYFPKTKISTSISTSISLSIISKWLLEYKKQPSLPLTLALAEVLNLFFTPQKNVFYVWIPIPMHVIKLNQTGFHHVYEILRLFVKLQKNPHMTILHLLEKNRNNTQHQASNIEQRKLAIQGLYQFIAEKAWKKSIENLQIKIQLQRPITKIKWVIFDDIVTSGLTTQESLRILKNKIQTDKAFQNWCKLRNIFNHYEVITLGRTVQTFDSNDITKIK